MDETEFNRGHVQAYGEHVTLKTEPVRMQLKDNAQPYAVHTAWHVPLAVLQKVKVDLHSMERNGIIEKVTQPTDWCTPMLHIPL